MSRHHGDLLLKLISIDLFEGGVTAGSSRSEVAADKVRSGFEFEDPRKRFSKSGMASNARLTFRLRRRRRNEIEPLRRDVPGKLQFFFNLLNFLKIAQRSLTECVMGRLCLR